MLRNYSHIYHEEGTLSDEMGRKVVEKFSRAELIKISDYREIFNRPRQDWRLQKSSVKIILAKRKSDFLYPGSPLTPSFNNENFYYNTLIMNCLFDCDYCYLQGMYPSANIVVFTNLEDYFTETSKMLSEKGTAYLSISYDTDLLAFENIAPYSRRWIEYAAANPNLKVELRTKSSNFSAIKDLEPCPNFILAWTLSPDNIAKTYEKNTPSLKARLSSAGEALSAGWNVRLCLDPVLLVENWAEHYSNLVHEIANTLPMTELYDISLGTFRMNHEFFKKTKDMRTDSKILHYPYVKRANLVTYEENRQAQALGLIRESLLNHLSAEKVFTI